MWAHQNISFFLRQACITMNFPLRTAFAVSHRFMPAVSSFSFVSRNFLISNLISFLTHSLFNSILLNLHEFECFWVFSLEIGFYFQSLVVRENAWYDFHFLKIFESCFCPVFCSVFENILCSWKECVFCFFAMKGSIYISVKSFWSRTLFNAAISLLIFCLEDPLLSMGWWNPLW